MISREKMKEILNKLKKYDTSLLSDVLDQLGLKGVITGILPINDGMKLAGFAVPVKAICGDKGDYPLEDFAVGTAIDIATKDDIIIFDLEGIPISTWGGMASQAAKNKGIAGIVANGGVRDIEEIQKLQFPVFAKHRIPISGKTRVKFLSINEPMECEGIAIESEDIIIGDNTGLIIISVKRALEILQRAKELETLESKFTQLLTEGNTFQEAARNLRHL